MRRRDVLAEMEKVTGKHHSEFTKEEQLLAIALHLHENERVEALNKTAGDTWFNMPYPQFKDCIQQYGFRLHIIEEFQPRKECVEELIIAFHPEWCLLLMATSYGRGTSRSVVNGGSVYGEVWHSAISKEDALSWQVLDGCSHGPLPTSTKEIHRRYFDLDVREGLFGHLQRLQPAGWLFADKWTAPHFVWLVDYAQTKRAEAEQRRNHDSDFYKHCTQERIRRLPEFVRNRIKVN